MNSNPNNTPELSPLHPTPEGSTHEENETPPITLIIKDWRDSTFLKLQIITCFMVMFFIGMTSQTIGSLIPLITLYYKISASTISLIFISQLCGNLISALIIELVHKVVGRLGVLILGNLCIIMMSLINIFKPPIWLFVMSYGFAGLGMGILGGCMNVFISSLKSHNELMGMLHGSFGIGGIVLPVIINKVLEWSFNDFGIHYLIMSWVGLLVCCCVLGSFWKEDGSKYEYEISVLRDDQTFQDNSLKNILKNKVVCWFALYLFFCTGSESSIGSWLVNYLDNAKQFDQSSANFIMTFFWIGITTGRIILGFITSKLFQNEYRANLVYTTMSLLIILIFTTINLITTMNQTLTILMIFIEGLFIGPLFPTMSVTLMKLLPIETQVNAMGVVSSLGGTGFTIGPFLIGMMIQLTGLEMFPIHVSILLLGSFITWLIIPRICDLKF